jgi:Xaa-Pro aminopeptidase
MRGRSRLFYPFASRQKRLRALLETRHFPFLLLSNPLNLFYLTGFRGSAGVAIFTLDEARLWVDPRYTAQAQEEAHGVDVVEEKGGLLQAAAKWLKVRKAGRVGYEDGHLTCAAFQALAARLPAQTKLVPAGGMVEELRYVKDREEIETMREAGLLTAEVFEEVRDRVRPGVREADLAAEIEFRLRRKGAEGAAFETIVASGPRSVLPHARASGKLLRKGELVIFDLGAILRGYVADMTRTLYLGRPDRRVRSLVAAVLGAQERARETLRPGVRAGKVDQVARKALARRGLARYFTHSAGHGLGLEIHERPRLGKGGTERLEEGCVVTVEPGIYMEGLGGIRIEDTVLVGHAEAEILTPAPKDGWAI